MASWPCCLGVLLFRVERRVEGWHPVFALLLCFTEISLFRTTCKIGVAKFSDSPPPAEHQVQCLSLHNNPHPPPIHRRFLSFLLDTWSPTYNRGDPFSILPDTSGLHLSVLFYRCSLFFIFMLLVSEGQADQALIPSIKGTLQRTA
jgi:hypothetical protein